MLSSINFTWSILEYLDPYVGWIPKWLVVFPNENKFKKFCRVKTNQMKINPNKSLSEIFCPMVQVTEF